MATFHILTFGCQMNVNDSAWLERALLNRGFTLTDKKQADFIIINTCSVRAKPEHKVHSLIGALRLINKKVKIVVAGCLAQQLGRLFLQKYKEVCLVLGTDNFDLAPNALEMIIENPRKRLYYLDFSDKFAKRDLFLDELQHNSPLAAVNIMQGCDNFCAYCIVPYVRGARKSRPSLEIIHECQALIAKGAKDITLLGQNVNVYGMDNPDEISFIELLYKLEKLEGLEVIRIMTSHPKDFPIELIEAYAKIKKLAPRLHLPIQSGSNRILNLMRRGYSLENYIELVQKLHELRPEMLFSTDIIVGFPDESEEDFAQTLDLVEKIPFIHSYSFCYSDRPGTKASLMSHKIPKEVQLERLERLQTKQNAYFTSYLSTLVASQCECIIEKINIIEDKIIYDARNNFDLSIHIEDKQNKLVIGQKVLVEIIDSKRHSLVAKVIK